MALQKRIAKAIGVGLTDNTLVIFTSDNGPVVDDGYADGSVEHLNGHKPAGEFRGGKYSIYEGGTRMPFIAHWPGLTRNNSWGRGQHPVGILEELSFNSTISPRTLANPPMWRMRIPTSFANFQQN
jgi:hypothetical protein